jgi:drug/metabolite transporter (DMT)-like permease
VLSDSSPRRAVPPLLAATVTVVLWASAFVAIRAVGRELSPGVLALGRLVTGSVVLGVLVGVRAWRGGTEPTRWPRGRAWSLVLVCGVCWFGIYNVALNAAERRVDAGTASILVKLGPVLVAGLAGVLLREGVPRRLVVGTGLAVAGVLVIGFPVSARSTNTLSGVLLCVVAAVGYAAGVLAQKPVLASVSALRTTWLACVTGAVSCLPFAGEAVAQLRSASLPTVGWVLYLGIGPTAIGFTCWAYALARSPAGRLVAMTYLVPPMTILLGWFLLAETPQPRALLGGGFCLAGVYLTQRRGSAVEPADAGRQPGGSGPAGGHADRVLMEPERVNPT